MKTRLDIYDCESIQSHRWDELTRWERVDVGEKSPWTRSRDTAMHRAHGNRDMRRENEEGDQ